MDMNENTTPPDWHVLSQTETIEQGLELRPDGQAVLSEIWRRGAVCHRTNVFLTPAAVAVLRAVLGATGEQPKHHQAIAYCRTCERRTVYDYIPLEQSRYGPITCSICQQPYYKQPGQEMPFRYTVGQQVRLVMGRSIFVITARRYQEGMAAPFVQYLLQDIIRIGTPTFWESEPEIVAAREEERKDA